MTIHEIKHEPDRSIKSAIIHLDYDEIKDIGNLLCTIRDNKECQTQNYKKLRRDFFFLFEIVKNGCIDGFTWEHLYKLNQDIHSDLEAQTKLYEQFDIE